MNMNTYPCNSSVKLIGTKPQQNTTKEETYVLTIFGIYLTRIPSQQIGIVTTVHSSAIILFLAVLILFRYQTMHGLKKLSSLLCGKMTISYYVNMLVDSNDIVSKCVILQTNPQTTCYLRIHYRYFCWWCCDFPFCFLAIGMGTHVIVDLTVTRLN